MGDDNTVEELEGNPSDLNPELYEVDQRRVFEEKPSLQNQHTVVEGPRSTADDCFQRFLRREDELELIASNNTAMDQTRLSPNTRHRSNDRTEILAARDHRSAH